MSVLATLLLLGWAALLPPGHRLQWWHVLIGVLLVLGFTASWHGQHLTSSVRRWVPMAYRNFRGRRPTKTKRKEQPDTEPDDKPDRPHKRRQRTTATPVGEATITIRLRPRPHAQDVAADAGGQVPWQEILTWLNRYAIRTDRVNITSNTATPPLSPLRRDVGHLVSAHTPQHRGTWITYTMSTQSNLAPLQARDTDIHTLADATARRLIGRLRELGWLATLVDSDTPLPRFVDSSTKVRRECWTGTEYATDGFRAVYAIQPKALSDVLAALPTLESESTWISLTVHARGNQPATIEAAAALRTLSRPSRVPLPGLIGFHGLHRHRAADVSALGINVPAGQAFLAEAHLNDVRWPAAAAGVPIGTNRQRQPVYLELSSPEPVRITITGDPYFQVGICSRLALTGLPLAIYTADMSRWGTLAKRAAPQQIQPAPPTVYPDWIVVTDGSFTGVPEVQTSVSLLAPAAGPPPHTTIVITQLPRQRELFELTTAHGSQTLAVAL